MVTCIEVKTTKTGYQMGLLQLESGEACWAFAPKAFSFEAGKKYTSKLYVRTQAYIDAGGAPRVRKSFAVTWELKK